MASVKRGSLSLYLLSLLLGLARVISHFAVAPIDYLVVGAAQLIPFSSSHLLLVASLSLLLPVLIPLGRIQYSSAIVTVATSHVSVVSPSSSSPYLYLLLFTNISQASIWLDPSPPITSLLPPTLLVPTSKPSKSHSSWSPTPSYTTRQSPTTKSS